MYTAQLKQMCRGIGETLRTQEPIIIELLGGSGKSGIHIK